MITIPRRLARITGGIASGLRKLKARRRPGPWIDGSQHPDSLLLVTLDSCRYDTFESAEIPNLRAVGPLHRAMAPGNFTFSSHLAMFVGFTPGDASRREAIVNPKFGKLVRLAGGATRSRGQDRFQLKGRSIIDGFNRVGYLTAGTGAVSWFNDSTETSRYLISDFRYFQYAGNTWSLPCQVEWMASIVGGADSPVFAFINVGETHVPYWHEGADWSREESPCRPFDPTSDEGESRRRQRTCLEFVDGVLAPVLRAFANANIMVCGDHGDAWGEDGLWEHGFHHHAVFEVPMLFRVSPSRADSAG